MNKLLCLLLRAAASGTLLIATACTATQPARNNNQANSNAAPEAVGNANTAQAQPSTERPREKPQQSGTGSIAIRTAPPGARVILIPLDEEGAEPEQKGLTPTTLTAIPVGKYTVNIEKPGYKYFQRNIKVEENKTTQVAGTLRRE